MIFDSKLTTYAKLNELNRLGIQFITLFALVIAIILFGITGILEGKELSALLGGLSGYILGRSTTTKSAEGKGPPEAPKEK